VADGTYHQRIAPTINGSSGAPITIRAINDGKAIIDGDTNGDGIGDLNSGPLLNLERNYFVIEGLVFNHGGRDCSTVGSICYQTGGVVRIYGGSNNILRRISAYNAHPDLNSAVIGIVTGNNNLIEDCVAAGSGRKMIYIFGADGTVARRNIIRRCVAAWQEWRGKDFNPGNWPWGDAIESYNASGNVYENLIAYGMSPGPGSGINIFSQSGILTTGNAILGTISVKAGMKFSGVPMTWACPNPDNTNVTCTNLVSWRYRSGFRLGNNDGSPVYNNLFQDIFSYGNAGFGFHVDLSSGNTNRLVRGTVLNNGLASGVGGVSMESGDRSFFNSWTNNYVQGVDESGTGARLTYRYQSSFDANGNVVVNLTSTPLWPWPMEDRIRAEFGPHLSRFLSLNPELKDFSVTNTMQSIFNSLPAAINPLAGSSGVDKEAPTTPGGLAAQAVSSSQIQVAWLASTDNVGVTGYRVYRNSVQVATTTATSYVDAGLSPSITYTYRVAAMDAAGNVSAQSSPASATTLAALDSTPPTVAITFPASGAMLAGVVNVTATAADNVAVAGVQFTLDGANLGSQDTIAPYSVTFDTTTVANGSHVLAAIATDTTGNRTTSAPVSVMVSNALQGTLSVSGVTDNRASYPSSQIPRYAKLEVTFQVDNSVATNLQLPYDPKPPAGIDPANYPMHKGISVDALFTPDNWQTTYRQPAFHYQTFDDQIKRSWDGQNREWHLPTASFAWKVRFSPTQTGGWQYKIVARDASGAAESPAYGFTVSTSTSRGFLKVSPTDPRYFEHDDGTPFYPSGINLNANTADPVLGNEALYRDLAQNRINLLRLWVSNIYGSAWLEWLGGRNTYDGYLPRSGLEPFRNPATGKEQMAQAIMYNDPTGWYDACRFQFWNDPPSIKRNTNYKLSIRYYGMNIAGPRISSRPAFGLVGKISTGWYPNCEEPNTGTVITNYGRNTSDWSVIEGTWNSGDSDFLPRIYIGLENATQGKAYLDSVSLREDLGGGRYGPEIINESSMQYELYYPQEASYSLDKLIALAERNDIYLKLVLSELNDTIYHKLDDDGTLVLGGKPDNPDGFYGLGRTVNRTRWLQQAWWRYVQARWGYSPNVHSWELVNEGDPFLVKHWEMADEFGKYMRCRAFGVEVGAGDANACTLQHPNRHMVTTSFWHSFPGYSSQTGGGFWGSPKYPNVDYADVHAYISTSPASLTEKKLMEEDSAYYHLWHSGQYGSWGLKLPVVRGEAGMDLATSHATTIPGLRSDSQGFWYHDYVWSSLDSGALYEMYWWFIPDIYNPGVYDHRRHALSYYNFLKGIPLNNGKYRDIAATVSNAALQAVGQKDLTNGRAHVWIRNKNHTWKNVTSGVSIAPVSGTVQIGGFVPGRTYTVEWWDTYKTTGQVTSTQSLTASSTGVLTLTVQQLASDIAAKIGSSAAAPANQAPVVNAGPDGTATVGVAVTLNGSATDDGLPSGSTLTVAWSKVSGPGTVTFGSPSSAITTAAFSAAGTYVVRLTASDSLLFASDDRTMVVSAPLDTTPPTISAVAAGSITASSAVISWTTNEPADRQVDYGPTTSYGFSSSLGTTLATSHSVTLNNLASGATYHYRVKSRDASGNLRVSGDFTFATPGAIPVSMRLSADKKHLVDAAGRPVFIAGDTAWSLIAQLSLADAQAYLHDRASRGFNLILVNLIEKRFASKAPNNSSNVAPFTTPGKFTTPNASYFAHADAVISYASQKGITVLLDPLYLGWECGDQGWCPEVQAASLSDMRAWGRYLGNRYRNFPNIVWLIGADANPFSYNVAGKVREMVAGISEYDKVHLKTAHNNPGTSAQDLWNGEAWLDLNTVYQYGISDLLAMTREEYTRTNALPLFILESAYENEHGSTPASLRQQAYGGVLWGGTLGSIFGNCPLWSSGYSAGYCAAADWRSQLGSTGSLEFGRFAFLMRSRPFWRLVPDHSHTVMTAGYGSGDTLATTARASDGSSIIAYIPTRRQVTIDMSKITDAGGRAKCSWYDPRTGTFTAIGTYATNGTARFTPPSWNDWVLVIDADSK
jgi:chitodextrinase